jgi:hypothetical protein
MQSVAVIIALLYDDNDLPRLTSMLTSRTKLLCGWNMNSIGQISFWLASTWYFLFFGAQGGSVVRREQGAMGSLSRIAEIQHPGDDDGQQHKGHDEISRNIRV